MQKRKEITKELLEDLYWKHGLTQRQIGKQFNLSQVMIHKYLQFFSIKCRRRNWRGGHPSANGYVLSFQPHHPRARSNGYVAEHVLIMEQYLGRSLTKEEVIHHINGDGTDNRIENLVLCANQAEHIHLYHPTTTPKCPKHPITGRFCSP